MPGVDLRSAPRALEAATRSDWDGVQLLMAQAESLEEGLLGDSPVTSEAWERLGFPPDGGLGG